MSAAGDFAGWNTPDARGCIAWPSEQDDKYSRGVLGMVTGSARYPGAAVLGAEAALGTGVGMVRYLGPRAVTRLVLQRRPEVVTQPGRVQAWLLGSGIDAAHRPASARRRFAEALKQNVPLILDAGALALAPAREMPLAASAQPRSRNKWHFASRGGAVILTPHHGELARLLGVDRQSIAADPAAAALRASERFGATVLLKGHETYIVGGGMRLAVTARSNWLATAGTGDALAGILGALVATHAAQIATDASLPARLAATACVIHSDAAVLAGGGGPFTVLGLTAAVPAVIRAMAAS